MRGNKGFEMNERIRQLADEAVTRVALRCEGSMESDKHGEWIRYNDLGKFAELIVKECAKVILETPVEYLEIDAMHRVRDRVKNHFGVEL